MARSSRSRRDNSSIATPRVPGITALEIARARSASMDWSEFLADRTYRPPPSYLFEPVLNRRQAQTRTFVTDARRWNPAVAAFDRVNAFRWAHAFLQSRTIADPRNLRVRRFEKPWLVDLCVRRRRRRQVLFAADRARKKALNRVSMGGYGAGRRVMGKFGERREARRTRYSDVRC